MYYYVGFLIFQTQCKNRIGRIKLGPPNGDGQFCETIDQSEIPPIPKNDLVARRVFFSGGLSVMMHPAIYQ
jgi:hypothetical protein